MGRACLGRSNARALPVRPASARSQVIAKTNLVSRGQTSIAQAIAESEILQGMRHPYIVSLHFAFQASRRHSNGRRRARVGAPSCPARTSRGDRAGAALSPSPSPFPLAPGLPPSRTYAGL